MKKLLALCLIMVSVNLWADGIVVPDGDPLAMLLALIQNWGAWGPLAIGSAVIAIAVQALKKFAGDFSYKRLVITVLGVVYGVVVALAQGSGVVSALVMALITSGGAVAIYEAFKNGPTTLLQK
jgi:type IV secretory pathway VirB2 component (pilin)